MGLKNLRGDYEPVADKLILGAFSEDQAELEARIPKFQQDLRQSFKLEQYDKAFNYCFKFVIWDISQYRNELSLKEEETDL